MSRAFVVDKDLFPATHAAQNRITRIAKHFKNSPEDLLQDSMVLELELQGRPDIEVKAGYLILATVNRQLKAVKKSSKTISIEEVHPDSSFLAVNIQRPLYIHLCLEEATSVLGQTDAMLADLFQKRRESDSWAEVYRAHYKGRSRSWFYERADEISKMVSRILENHGATSSI